MTTLTIFIPSDERSETAMILDGSAIVGRTNAAGMAMIDYEGNVFARPELANFMSRLKMAASRHIVGLPSRARLYAVPRDELIPVGAIDAESGHYRITNAAALAGWANIDGLPESA